jgi:hypothetical protein
MACRAMKRLANSLDDSSCAAAFVGPKILSPAAWNASTTPAASGRLGTDDRGVDLLVPREPDQLVGRGDGDVEKAILVRGAAVARRHVDARDLRRLGEAPRDGVLAAAGADDEKLHLVPEVPHSREYHRDTVLVRRGDHLRVAQASPGLDHRRARRPLATTSSPSLNGKNASMPRPNP